MKDAYDNSIPSFMIRIWLADRPGALAQVAGRIGAVGGDVINIDILERDNGRAIDDLYITLPEGSLIPLMLTKISELDDVGVEDIRELQTDLSDAIQDPLQISYELISSETLSEVLRSFVAGCSTCFNLDWAVMYREEDSAVVTASGDMPSPAWLDAFVAGLQNSSEDIEKLAITGDTAWIRLDKIGLMFIFSRLQRSLRSREKRQLLLLAQIAGKVIDTFQ